LNDLISLFWEGYNIVRSHPSEGEVEMHRREDEVKTTIPVRDIMAAPVVTVHEDANMETVAKLMDEHELGSMIVTSKDGQPMGIITERDVVVRVTANNQLPSNVKAGNIMSRPLRTISPDADIKDAASEMHRLGIRRLVVMEKGRMIGIISSKDIVAITPSLIEVITEKARITSTPLLPYAAEAAGVCERCRQWSDGLREYEGRSLCEDCRIELGAEEG
jgi:CBS domain-containing protein